MGISVFSYIIVVISLGLVGDFKKRIVEKVIMEFEVVFFFVGMYFESLRKF